MLDYNKEKKVNRHPYFLNGIETNFSMLIFFMPMLPGGSGPLESLYKSYF